MPYIEPDSNATSLSKARIKKFATIFAAVIFFGMSTGKELKALMGPEAKEEVRADVSLTGTGSVTDIAAINNRLAEMERLQANKSEDTLRLQLEIASLKDTARDNRETIRFLDMRLRTAEAQITLLKP